MEPKHAPPFSDNQRSTAAYALRMAAKGLRERAAEFDELAKVADTMVPGSPAEQALWELVANRR